MRRRITSSLSNHRMNRWENMLNVICRRLCRGATQLDDAMAVARRELLYAMIHFEPARARFVTYLYARVRGKVRHFLDSERRHQRVELMDAGMLADMAGGEADDPSEALTAHEILDGLSERERTLLWGHLAEGKSVRQVAREMGCPHVNLFSVRHRAVARVRQMHPALMVEPPPPEARRRIA